VQKTLRWTALLGALVVLASDLIGHGSWQPRQEYSVVALVLVTLATAVTLIFLLPRASRSLRAEPDLLVPLGLYVLAQEIVGWLAMIPGPGALLTLSETFRLLSVPVTISLQVVLHLLLTVAFATWTLTLVCRVTLGRSIDFAEARRDIFQGFWRTLAYMAISVAVFLGGLALALGAVASPLALVTIVLATPAINFATAGLLLHGIAGPRRPFWRVLRDSVTVSWKHLGRWWKPMLAQMEILGLVTFVSLSFHSSGHSRSVSNWAVHGMWTGGFENSSRWLSAFMGAAESAPPAFVVTFLGLVLGTLSIAVKLRIARELHALGELAADGGSGF